MQIVVFEDEHVSRLYPITVGRPAYAIGCGSFRLIDWLARLSKETGASLFGVVRPHLAAIQKLDFPTFSATPPTSHTPLLAVNARLAPSVAAYRALARLVKNQQTAAVYENGSLAAALIASGGPADRRPHPTAKSITGKNTSPIPCSTSCRQPTPNCRSSTTRTMSCGTT